MTSTNTEDRQDTKTWSFGAHFAAALICSAAVPPAIAAEPEEPTINEVVVTSRKIEQRLQDTPVSVTALTGEQLGKLGMDEWRDWADFVPSLHISTPPNGDRNGINPVIRGIVNTNHSSSNATMASATTSLTIGDVPIFGVDPRLPDMSRVEVLKGPQGTLYGAAAMGGLIKFVPNPARHGEFEAMVKGGTGIVTDGGQDFDMTALANVPLVSDILAIRGVAYYRRESGFVDVRIRGLSEIGTAETTPQLALVNGLTEFFDVRECKTSAVQTGNTATCIKDANETTVSGMRVTATYTPNDRLEIRPTFMQQKRTLDHNNNVDGNDPLDRYAERFMTLPSSEAFWFASLEGLYDFGPVDLNYVGGRLRREYGVISDFTYGIFGDKNRRPLVPGTPPMTLIPAPMPLNFENDSLTTTHEVRLTVADYQLGSLFGSPVRTDLVVGYFHAKDRRNTTLDAKNPEWNLRAPAEYQMLGDECYTCTDTTLTYTNSSVFADLTLHLTERFAIGGGARHFEQKLTQLTIEYGDSRAVPTPQVTLDTTGNNPGSPTSFPPVRESDVTTRAGLQYRIGEDHLAFYNYGEGFRLGLFQNPSSLNNATPQCRALAEQLRVDRSQVDSDKVTSHEIGLKSAWLDSKLLINPSIYYSKWSDLQQSVILTSIDSTCPQVLSGNIGAAEIKGVELEMALQLENLSINGSLTYTDAAISDAPPGSPGRKGDLIAGVPEWTASLGAEYSFPLAFTQGFRGYFRADWRYVDSRQLNFGTRATQNPLTISRPYNIGNVRLGMEGELWDAALFIDNVTDEEASFSSRIVTGVAWAEDRSVNRPRTLGVTVTRYF